MRKILIGIAAVALAAGPALAQGNGKGNGGGKGGGGGDHAAQSMQAANPGKGGGNGGGGGGGKERGNQSAKADRGTGGGSMMQASEYRGGGKEQAQVRGPDRDDRGQAARAERGNGNGKGNTSASNPGRGNDRKDDRTVVAEGRGNDTVRGKRFDDDVRVRTVFAENSRGLVDGCPPGLAAKNNGCRPPGLARQEDAAWRNSLYRPDWWGLSDLGSGRYAYDDGYLYRLNDAGTVAGFIPLLGGALGIGNPWPSFYDPVPLPSYYQNYFGLGPSNSYRYADDVIYRVDPETSAITAIAALLTGDQFAVGQPMPLGYDVYNVPYAYRDQYYDTPDSWYRYSDGYVYEVDPETRLIAAAIELLT